MVNLDTWDKRFTTRVLGLMKSSSINVEFLENKAGEIAAGAYLLFIAEIVYSVQQIGTGALLIGDNFILGLIWGNDSSAPFNVSGLCNPGPDTLWKLRDKIIWVLATLNDWLNFLVI